MKPILCVLGVCLGFGLAMGGAAAQTPATPPAGHELTAADAEAFLDGLLPASLARGDIAGAVVVVVKDGQVLFEHGYGHADVARQTPVDPKRTLFRPGSVSKLFTWTAVMQLAEAGKLDLDRDINAYLDFKIPQTWPKPITLRNLMTHTAGFEESYKPLLEGTPNGVPPLGDVVKRAMPERLFPPGEVPAYSNYGATLAGYIVERVSGEPFDRYVEHHIFQPLGMTHSTFDQPLPKSIAADMSKGYDVASGEPTPFETIGMAPAGALSASGDDIAHFMIAHLNNGAYGTARILGPEMAVRMHGVAFRPFEKLPAMAYGFYHEDRNGHVVIAHGGDTSAFHSDLTLVLDANTGIFISMNSAGKDGASSYIRRTLLQHFMDRYFPASVAADEPTLKSAAADGALVAGTYEVSRRGDSNFSRIASLFSVATVSANPDGTITVSELHDTAGNPEKWREVAPFYWRLVNGDRHVAATFKNGHVDQLGTDQIGPVMVFMPAPLSRASTVNLPLYIATLAMLALTVLFWPIKAVLRWRYDRPFALTGRAATLYRLTRAVALFDLVFLASWPVFFTFAGAHIGQLPSSADMILRAMQVVGVIGILGTPVLLYELAIALGDGERPWWTKFSDLLLVLAGLATIWFAFSLRLLTWTLNY